MSKNKKINDFELICPLEMNFFKKKVLSDFSRSIHRREIEVLLQN